VPPHGSAKPNPWETQVTGLRKNPLTLPPKMRWQFGRKEMRRLTICVGPKKKKKRGYDFHKAPETLWKKKGQRNGAERGGGRVGEITKTEKFGAPKTPQARRRKRDFRGIP